MQSTPEKHSDIAALHAVENSIPTTRARNFRKAVMAGNLTVAASLLAAAANDLRSLSSNDLFTKYTQTSEMLVKTADYVSAQADLISTSTGAKAFELYIDAYATIMSNHQAVADAIPADIRAHGTGSGDAAIAAMGRMFGLS